MILILNHIEIDKVAQVRAGVPTDIVGVHIDLAELFDHFHLIYAVGFGPWGSRCQVCCRILVVMMVIGDGNVDSGERE